MAAATAIEAKGSGRFVMGGPSDHELVASVRCGDDRAFEELYGRYQRRIAAYIYGMVNDYARAEDITQDVFISALRRMRETERPIAFKPWVYEIAKNACIDQFRRSRRAEEVSYDAEEGLGAADYGRLVTTGPSPDAAVDTKQQLSHLCGAFGGLSETHHEILVLRELEGLSYREIGERMGLSRPSVESTLFRARRRLTEEYDELVSGQRCIRIQAIIAGAAESILGARDTRRLARHVAHCQPCRRQAIAAGIDTGTITRRGVGERIAAKVAGFFPVPLFLRGRRGADEGTAGAGGGQGLLAQVPAVSAVAEPVVLGWGKAAVAAATVVLAGVGAGAATQHGARDLVTPAPQRATAPVPAPAKVDDSRGPADLLQKLVPTSSIPAPVASDPAARRNSSPADAPAVAPRADQGPLLSPPPATDDGVPPELRDGPKAPPEIGGGQQQQSGLIDNLAPRDNTAGESTPPITEEVEAVARSINGDAGQAVSDVRDALGG